MNKTYTDSEGEMNNNLEKHGVGEEVYCECCQIWTTLQHFSRKHDASIVKAIDRIETNLIGSLRDLRVVREYLTEDHRAHQSRI